MRLSDSISLVGSGDIGGFSLTHPLDCHMYLLNGQGELALLDAGAGVDLDGLYRHITADGYRLANIKYLILTHAHFDHAGGAARLQRELNLKVIASRQTAQIVSAGDAETSGFAPLQRVGLYPAELTFTSCPVDVIVDDGTTFTVGNSTLRAIATPGHSADHFSYLLLGERQLFAGDTVLAGGKVLIQNLPDVRLDDYRSTITKLNDLDVTGLLPGHGLITLARADRHLRAAQAVLERFAFPENALLD